MSLWVERWVNPAHSSRKPSLISVPMPAPLARPSLPPSPASLAQETQDAWCIHWSGCPWPAAALTLCGTQPPGSETAGRGDWGPRAGACTPTRGAAPCGPRQGNQGNEGLGTYRAPHSRLQGPWWLSWAVSLERDIESRVFRWSWCPERQEVTSHKPPSKWPNFSNVTQSQFPRL